MEPATQSATKAVLLINGFACWKDQKRTKRTFDPRLRELGGAGCCGGARAGRHAAGIYKLLVVGRLEHVCGWHERTAAPGSVAIPCVPRVLGSLADTHLPTLNAAGRLGTRPRLWAVPIRPRPLRSHCQPPASRAGARVCVGSAKQGNNSRWVRCSAVRGGAVRCGHIRCCRLPGSSGLAVGRLERDGHLPLAASSRTDPTAACAALPQPRR